MKSELVIDPYAIISKIDDRIYGSFVEHLGRAVYGGIYQPGHEMADGDGFRQDVLAYVKKLRVPIVRYPGGNFVSGFNWEDSIGPKEQRPTRLELAWKTKETNAFGLHEFMRWSKKANTDVMMAVNLGTRGIDSARQLVEYCNFPKGTFYSDLRRKNGAEDPFRIKTWCLGNEMDGPWQLGHKTAAEYGRLAEETSKVVKLVDCDIETVACGSSMNTMPTFGSWEATVLDLAYDQIDYLSLHRYYDNNGDTPNFLAQSLDFDSFIDGVVSICDAVKAKKHQTKSINLSFDEWNIWHPHQTETLVMSDWQVAPHHAEAVYNLEDAILVGSLLITLIKHSDRVKIACLAQLVNVLAPIMTEETGQAWVQTIFYPLMQASTLGRGIALKPVIKTPSYETEQFNRVPYLDSVVVEDQENGYLTVFAVNKSLQDHMDLDIRLSDEYSIRNGQATQFTGPDAKQDNRNGELKIEPNSSLDISEGKITIKLAPLSWNVIRLKVKNEL
ncbi:arabinosylfuranosidase ArfA [Lapidilactobacillus salsurivasis]